MNRMDDLISRQAAIDAIVNTVSGIGLHDNSEVARYGATFRQHEIIDIIEGMPSAQPEQKHGRWIPERLQCTNGGSYQVYRCDQCQEAFNWEMDFCGGCGADMRGEQDE